eukprot:m.111815 g.111815  ORF g.111815 m.111815 type:complete len:224 (+) comp51835_c0_seq1:16-687(+)
MSEEGLVKEATEFIQATLGTPLTAPFKEALKNGAVLCQFLNKLKPGSVKEPKVSKIAFVCMENIAAYTAACRAMGLSDDYNFVTVDLWEGSNIKQVATNVVALKRLLGFATVKEAPDMVPVSTASDQTTRLAAASSALSSVGQGCRECNRNITAGKVEVKLSSGVALFYHPQCFLCKKCGKTLAVGAYKMREEQPYCENCAAILNSSPSVRVKLVDTGFKFDK